MFLLRKTRCLTLTLGWVLLSLHATFADETRSDGANKTDRGVGPVTEELKLEPLNASLAAKGKTVYNAKCSACHKIDTRYVGPALKGITERRSPEWILNMILNPEGMVAENETAKELLGEYMAPMANQNLTRDDARAVLEYFRQSDTSPAAPPAPKKK